MAKRLRIDYYRSLDAVKSYIEKKTTTDIPSSCENYQKFYSRIYELYSAEELTDVKIVCQNHIFKCHRLVLAAASEYFERMFCSGFRENRTEEIPLQNIDAATFEGILEYIYQGKITVHDLNVCGLLYASEMLGLNFIENVCVQYLIESDIPLSDALEIFVFAVRTQKNCLLRAASHFLVENMNYFFCNSDFLQLSFEDLKTLLQNCPPLSSKKENLVIETLVRWIKHSDCALEDKKDKFFMLTQTFKFQHLQRIQIEEYFNKNFNDELGLNLAYLDRPTAARVNKSTIHLYARTGADEENEFGKTYLIKMQNNNAGDDVKKVDWHSSHLIESKDIQEMRTVVFNNRFYCFKSSAKQPWLRTFTVSSSVDLTSNSSLLTLPPDFCSSGYSQKGLPTFNLFCDMNSIYLYNYSCHTRNFDQLFVYSEDSEKWSSISLNREERVQLPAAVCDWNRLYLIGGTRRRSPIIRYLQSYDHRVGRWEQLPESRLSHHHSDSACIHKGKIYVCNHPPPPLMNLPCKAEDNVMEIYDIKAGKWDAIRMDDPSGRIPTRLLSFDNELYAFYDDSSIQMRTYDSFAQKWSLPSDIASAIGSRHEWVILSALTF